MFGYFYILVAVLAWGFLGVFGRIVMSEGLAPLDMAFWRALLGGCFMLCHAFFIKDIRVHSGKDLIAFILFGVFSIASLFVTYNYAILDGGVALASVLLYTAPIWVAIFSRIFFLIPLTKMTLLAIGVALVGVSLISFSGTAAPSQEEAELNLPYLGIIFGLLSGFFYATHYVFTKKYLVIYSPFIIYGYCSIVAACCLLPFTSLTLDMSKTAWFGLFAIGFISTYIGFWSYCEGMKRLNPTMVAVMCNLEPLIATVAAWYIWDESFSLIGWTGAALILCTVFIFILNDARMKKNLKP